MFIAVLFYIFNIYIILNMNYEDVGQKHWCLIISIMDTNNYQKAFFQILEILNLVKNKNIQTSK